MTAKVIELKQPNPSGIEPSEFNVLVLPKKVEDKSKGGIILPDETKDRDQFAQMHGELVAVSPVAFTYADWNGAKPPRPGDHVLFAKYSGAKVTGKDGIEYRIVKDKDVAAVLS